MSNLYASAPDTAYLVATPFYLPTETGSLWAIAFTNSGSQFLNAALAILLMLIFPWVWDLVCFVAIYAAPSPTRLRSVAMVTLCNSPDPWFAFKNLAVYTYDCFGFAFSTQYGRTVSCRDFMYGFTFSFIALAVFVVSIVMGIIGPSFVHVGNLAPVRSSMLFYAGVSSSHMDLDYASLPAHTVMQALGGVDCAGDRVRSKVHLEVESFNDLQTNEPMRTIRYGYNLTGLDLGLPRASDLVYAVKGSCTTEYTWLQPQDPDMEHYDLWHTELNSRTAMIDYSLHNQELIRLPPLPFLRLHPDALQQNQDSGNVSYAIVLGSMLRPSRTEGSDPWYATELYRDSESAKLGASFRVRRGRPALSCWQQDIWSYGTEHNKSVSDLRNLSGLDIPEVFLEVLEETLTYPLIKTIGSNGGVAAFESAFSSSVGTQGLIDAEKASIKRDMERLILASYLSTENIFIYAALNKDGHEGDNIFMGENGQPREGADQLVIRTPDVETFSLLGLIVLAALVVGIQLIRLLLGLKLILHRDHNPLPDREQNLIQNDDRWARIKAMSAVQLFRNVYEREQGSPQSDWSCGEGLPRPTDSKMFKLVKCKKSEICCGGHIATEPGMVVDRKESCQSGSSILAGQEKPPQATP
ncbi:hypothetical protein DL769_000460 [Monosporascus sp. CRB-8-3]|nr:hypothetical protein DL769_000460 [Monosporascus sp. CRB-8-3]